ncbi:pyridoxal phosphate-dependent transferase [Aspergillus minisclerotigenes]|uniref:Pyridoxal phosphate-dependent transferase n=1 Tax=Aspergillus minisclerotigenes TaxID=656917 RepID=A0A5N6JBQ1_9EURO|nr:pyridoxal phosphate-dependent transferase [Aspergillus minisclerotigenes]
MGTTSTCAVDDFEGITAVLKEKKEWSQIWVHIDAAYAGLALVVEEYHNIAAPWADNFFCVRNRKDLIETFKVNTCYLRNIDSDAGSVVDYRNWQIPLGRRFRSLKYGLFYVLLAEVD